MPIIPPSFFGGARPPPASSSFVVSFMVSIVPLFMFPRAKSRARGDKDSVGISPIFVVHNVVLKQSCVSRCSNERITTRTQPFAFTWDFKYVVAAHAQQSSILDRDDRNAMSSSKTRRQGRTTLGGVRLPTVPLDVVDVLLEHAALEDRRALAPFSLVSHAWHELARPRLFSTLTVTRKYTFDDFFDFLAEHPHLVRYIRGLKLRRGYHLARTEREPENLPESDADLLEVEPRADAVFLNRFFLALPKLKELTLEGLGLVPPGTNLEPGADLDAMPRGPYRLRRLVIKHFWRPWLPFGYGHALLFLALFDADAVEVTDNVLNDTTTVPGVPHFDFRQLIRPVRVRELSLTAQPRSFPGQPFDAGLYNDLRNSLAPGCLRSLEGGRVNGHDALTMDALGALLAHAGRDFRHLGLPINLGDGGDLPQEWRRLGLERYTNLACLTLELGLPKPRSRYDGDAPLGAAVMALLSHVGPSLRAITLRLQKVEEQAQIKSERTLGLGALDAMVCERFPDLDRFCLDLRGRRTYGVECILAARKIMAGLRERGILEVVSWGAIGSEAW
ncbi:hypothetical protein BD413DRAFT_617723 [Trametes elegans]|nr:hypothetical protein BD413DRAFT_617723 [Trametes elegans]